MRKTALSSAQDMLEMLAADIHERSVEHGAGVTVTGFKFVNRGDIRWGIDWFDEVNGAQTTYAMTLYDAWIALAYHVEGNDPPPFK